MAKSLILNCSGLIAGLMSQRSIWVLSNNFFILFLSVFRRCEKALVTSCEKSFILMTSTGNFWYGVNRTNADVTFGAGENAWGAIENRDSILQ